MRAADGQVVVIESTSPAMPTGEERQAKISPSNDGYNFFTFKGKVKKYPLLRKPQYVEIMLHYLDGTTEGPFHANFDENVE